MDQWKVGGMLSNLQPASITSYPTLAILTSLLFQISKEELLNPIKQDVKKGKLRFVRNCFPHKGYLWNYGAFPQVRQCQPSCSAEADCFLDMGGPQRHPPRD